MMIIESQINKIKSTIETVSHLIKMFKNSKEFKFLDMSKSDRIKVYNYVNENTYLKDYLFCNEIGGILFNSTFEGFEGLEGSEYKKLHQLVEYLEKEIKSLFKQQEYERGRENLESVHDAILKAKNFLIEINQSEFRELGMTNRNKFVSFFANILGELEDDNVVVNTSILYHIEFCTGIENYGNYYPVTVNKRYDIKDILIDIRFIDRGYIEETSEIKSKTTLDYLTELHSQIEKDLFGGSL